MMTRVMVLTCFVLLTNLALADQSNDWLKRLEHPRYSSEKLKRDNELVKYSGYDVSTLLVPRDPFLGYIGSDYRRLNIYFTSVSKSQKEGDVYLIAGISLVGTNKCDFVGSIRIEQVREYETLHFGVDDTYKGAGIKAEGVLIGHYKLEETAGQNHSGIFEGVMTSAWVVDRNGIIHPDHIELYSDNYRNNQYIGSWTEYGKNNAVVANWGEARIPFSSALDNGAAEFHPDEKYLDKGWRDLNLP